MSFADSFWTEDYHSGHEVLFDELYEGVKENDDFIVLFTIRMDSEFKYGMDLQQSIGTKKLSSKRHANDDYVSTVKNAFGEISGNFQRQGEHHLQIAVRIKEEVLEPFTKWCKEHEQRVGYSEKVVADKYKQYSGARGSLEKLQKKYFNKCRLVEDFKSHYSEEELGESMADLSIDEISTPSGSGATETDEENQKNYSFGGSVYDSNTAKRLVQEILKNIELSSHKVPILGTYHNVSSGSSITQWLLDNLPELRGNIAKAESFGQDLVGNGFIRQIGSMNVSKNFINSSSFQYQWKPFAFEFTGLTEFDLSKQTQNENYDAIAASGSRTNQFSAYFEDMKQAIGVTAVDFNDKSQFIKLVKEVNSLDAQYYETTRMLDAIRCEYEETVMDHLAFMQKCELDRLKAVKKATFDFIAVFSNKLSSFKTACDELLLVEETMHPVGDLKILIENYATGNFRPHVTLYDNYYMSNVRQIFGVELSVKARLDKKAVPIIVQTLLSYLDTLYPELGNDEERVNLWTDPVHLAQIHKLRQVLNVETEPHQILDVLRAHEPAVVTNVLKLYFMELPDSIVSHTFFDLIKTLYSSYGVGSEDPNADKSRVTGLQNILMELPVCNLATLDALLTHLNRLIQIISSKNEDLSVTLKNRLCREFGALVLRPKHGAAEIEGKSVHAFNQATEMLQQNFIADLFAHKETIFGELRRRNSKKPSRNNSANGTRSKSSSLKVKTNVSSRLRLESKLRNAVQNATEHTDGKHEGESERENERTRLEVAIEPTKALKSSTLPLNVPSKNTSSFGGSPLRRSTSPNKKRLSALLDMSDSGLNIKDESVQKNGRSLTLDSAILMSSEPTSPTKRDTEVKGQENVIVLDQ